MPPTRAVSASLALALIVALAAPQAAVALTSADLYEHQRAAQKAREQAGAEQKKADALVAETQRLQTEIDAVAVEVAALEDQIGTATARRRRLEDEIGGLRDRIHVKQTEIDTTQGELDAQTEALGERVNATYRAGDWVYIDWLLGANSIRDLLERTTLVQRIMVRDEEIAQELEDTRTQLESAKGELNRSLDEVSAKRAEIKAEEDRLRSLHTQKDLKLQAGKDAKTKKNALLAETKQNVARLKAAAAAEDAESARIAAELGMRGGGSGAYAGAMVWPTPGYRRVSSKFGMRYHPILHYNRMHTGIDIAAPSGAKIVAVGGGKVITAGWRGGYGNTVMIDHGNGVVSVYGHMSRVYVRVGRKVGVGERIGAVGSTGLATGPHLHFEIRVNGTAKNPLNYI